MDTDVWKRCSSCKKEIPFSSMYYQCSISTCQHKRKGFQFCSVPCWDAHLGYANHRTKAYAEERTAPSKIEFNNTQKEQKVMSENACQETTQESTSSHCSSNTDACVDASTIKTDTLVVVSKAKKLIKEQSGLNTSKCAVEALTQKVVEACLQGIASAKNDNRKTVMGRDIL